MSYDDHCYDPPGTTCSGKAQPGTRALRAALDELIPELGDYGIYNCRPTRTGSSLSLHGEGRAWDAALSPSLRPLGLKIADFLVDAHHLLGIQRVIYWEREWDSRVGEQQWDDYSGPEHHDHLHIEQCWAAAKTLTVEQVVEAYQTYWKDDDLTADQAKKLDEIWKALYAKRDGKVQEHLNLLETKIDEILSKLDG